MVNRDTTIKLYEDMIIKVGDEEAKIPGWAVKGFDTSISKRFKTNDAVVLCHKQCYGDKRINSKYYYFTIEYDTDTNKPGICFISRSFKNAIERDKASNEWRNALAKKAKELQDIL